jgi:tRNA pseudouridine65 synthase
MQILFEDESLIAINKPSGMLVHPTEAGLSPQNIREETCLSALRGYCKHHVFPVHRLDRATSGVLIFAKNSLAAAALCTSFEQSNAQKEYIALVRGWMPPDVEVDHPVWNEIRTQRLNAKTSFSLLEKFELPTPSEHHATSRYSLVSAKPHTGRYHQIRQHLKHLSHPIVGDTAHGNGKHNRFFRERFGLQRLFLHSKSLEIMHSMTHIPITLTAEIPEELNTVLSALREFKIL